LIWTTTLLSSFFFLLIFKLVFKKLIWNKDKIK
jgi:hypothetical protein